MKVSASVARMEANLRLRPHGRGAKHLSDQECVALYLARREVAPTDEQVEAVAQRLADTSSLDFATACNLLRPPNGALAALDLP